jgi:hypothetical protein
LRFARCERLCPVALSIKLTDINWESIRDVQIEGRKLEIVTDNGSFAFNFADVDAMSEGLLILALNATKEVRFVDDPRFNPGRFFQA